MASKFRLANSPVVDDNGFANGTIESITFLEEGESDYSGEQFEFTINTKGTQKDISLKIWTGVKINSDTYSNGKSKEFNKLTRLCIALGLIKIADLKAIKNEADLEKLNLDDKFESLKGQNLQFKLTKNPKSKGLSQIDLETIKLVES